MVGLGYVRIGRKVMVAVGIVVLMVLMVVLMVLVMTMVMVLLVIVLAGRGIVGSAMVILVVQSAWPQVTVQ